MTKPEAIEILTNKRRDFTYGEWVEANNIAVKCIEKCMKIKTITANVAVDMDYLNFIKGNKIVDIMDYERYVKRKVRHDLMMHIIDIPVTIEEVPETRQVIYRTKMEVVSND